MKRVLVVVCCSLSLVGCASMFGGTSQEMEITSSPAGANCAIEREGKVIGRVDPTPGATMIEKSRKDLKIVCVKSDFQEAFGYSKSGVEPWVFANLAFGGLIGLGIDHMTGGVNEYDSPVHVSLAPAIVEKAPPAPPPVESMSPADAEVSPTPTS